ncbi:MAG TPA: hypothetical protein VEP49_12315 [Acidimicrobiia bacterium]|nr:hypothetical protein [Acidimicrobiia bacterium]
MTHGRTTVVVAAAFAAGLGVAAALLFTGSGESARLTWRAGSALPRSLAAGATTVDSTVPVPVADDVTAWTGSELLTFGVDGSRNVGAVYEPRSGRWRRMSDIPFGTVVRGADGVWTGSVWVVVGVLCDRIGAPDAGTADACDPGTLVAAAYEPDTDTWRTIDAAPYPMGSAFVRGHSSSFGQAVGMLGDKAVFLIQGQYYAFRPASWDWEWLWQPRVANPVACSVRRALLAYDPASRSVSELEPGAAKFHVVGAPAPGVTGGATGTVCTDRGIFVSSPDLHENAVFDLPTRTWNAVPAAPASVTTSGAGAFTGRRVLFGSATGATSYDPRARAWEGVTPGLTAAPTRVSWFAADEGLYFPQPGALVAYRAR